MLHTFLWTSLLFASSAFVSADSVCEKAPFAEFAALSSYEPAASFCENSYPAPECKDGTLIVTSVTATSTISTTVTSTISSTTATITSAITSGTTTATITAPASTITATQTTSWVVVFQVTSTYVRGQIVARDAPTCTVVPASCTTYLTSSLIPVGVKTVDPEKHACLSSLKQQPSSVVSAACSCIAPQATCTDATATSTKLIEATVTSSITKSVITSVAVTIQTTVEAVYTTTATPTVTTTTTTISTFSSTSTVWAASDNDHCYGGDRCYTIFAFHQRCAQRIDIAAAGLVENFRGTVGDLYECFGSCSVARHCWAYDYIRATRECVRYDFGPAGKTPEDIDSVPAVGIDSGILFSSDCSKSV